MRAPVHGVAAAAWVVAAAFAGRVAPAAAQAQPAASIVELGECPTASGEVIRPCRIAYRTFGRLNAARDNAVLVPTWYGGTSASMTFLLGADAWIDTTRFHAVLVDAPGFGVGSSPSSSTTQPGRRFPRLTVEDMVAAQRRLVTGHLGLTRLHAVVGWSMGGMQALAWAMYHPDVAERAVSVAGTPRMGAAELYWVRSSLSLLDLAERAALPPDSLARHLTELWHLVGTTAAYENRLPRDSIGPVVAREAAADWIPFHREDNRLQLEALAAFDLTGAVKAGRAPGRARGRVWLLYVPGDRVTTEAGFLEFARLTGAEAIAYPSECGHVAPVCETSEIGAYVRRLLAERTLSRGR